MKKLFTSLLMLCFVWMTAYSQVYIDENFDTDIPATWSTDSEQDANPWFYNNGTGFQSLDGTGYARVDADAAGSVNYLVENLESPGFDASAGNIVIIQFDTYYNDYIGLDTGYVQVWDGTVWNTVWQIGDDLGGWSNPVAVTAIITDHVNPSGDTKIRFHYDDGDTWAYYWNVDNVVVSSVDCLEPVNIIITEGAIAADIEWQSGSGNSDLLWGLTGFDPLTEGTLITGLASPYLLTGLDPETTYDIYIKDDCGIDGESGYAGPITFTTTVACPEVIVPFNPFSNPTATSIDISFTPGGLGDVYIILGEPGFILGDAGDTIGPITSPYTIGGLTELTFYDVYWFMDCSSDALGTSNTSLVKSFNTLTNSPGTSCSDPIILNNNLPYNVVEQSICGYGDNVTLVPTPCGNWVTGYEEIVFAYSPETDDEVLGIFGSSFNTNSTVYFEILDMCPDSANATCISSGSWTTWSGDETFLLDDALLTNGETYYIMITAFTGSGCTFDLSIFVVSCATPGDLAAVSNTDGTAELDWVSTSGATSWQVEWGVAGFLIGEGTVVNGEYGVDGPPITIEGLTAENNYDYYVIDICGFGNSSFAAGPFEFSGPPPANNLCADAISIDCGADVTGNTAAATTDGNPIDFCGTGLTANSVWYTFIGTGDDVELSLCGSDYDTKIHLFSGDCDNLVCVGGNDDNFANCQTNGLNSYLYASTVVGVTYYIIVSGFSSSTGIYNLSYNCITCPLINGLTASATDVSASINWNTTNVGGTYFVEYGLAGFIQGTGTEVTGTIGTDGPPVDITGLTIGTPYDVYVYEVCAPGDTNSTLSTSFTTNLLPPPANDLCTNAFTIACGGSDSGSTTDATQIGNPIVPLCGFSTLNSMAVWYTFVGNDQLTTITTCGSDFDTELFVFTGDCDSLECVIVADGNGGACVNDWGPSALDFLAEDGVTYYVAVAGWSQWSFGNYQISMECTACGDPSGLNVGATDISAAANWSTFLPGADYTIAYGIAGSDIWNDGTILTGSNSDLPIAITGLTAGTTYDLCMFEYCTADMVNTDTLCTTFTTNLFPAPDNDTCVDAETIACGDVVDGNTESATTIGNPTEFCGTGLTAASVWYTFVGTGANITLSLEGSTYDTKVHLFSGDDCNNLTCIGGNDDFFGLQSYLAAGTEEGVTYYIIVSGFSSGTGDYTMDFQCIECNISDLIVTQIGTSATIFWTGNDLANYVIEYGPTGFTQGDGTIITGSTGSPVQLIGLDDNTTYDVYVYETCTNGATSVTLSSTFDVVDAINELNFEYNVSVYPNPVKDKLIIEVTADLTAGTTISIISMQGQVIYMEEVKENTSDFRTEIDVDNYARGMYLLRLEDENSSIQQRIIVQ